VVVYHRYTCRRCRYCLAGQRNLCPYRDPGGRRAYGANPDGADAEYMVAHAADLLPLAPDFDFLDGAVLACQAGTAYYGLRHIRLDGTDRLLVTGLGPVGLLAFMFARAMGAETIGVDPSPERRELARRLGLQRVLDPAEAPLEEQTKAAWPDGATAWAETSGAGAVHATIPAAAAINARVAIIGLGRSAPALSLPSLMGKQITVVASNLWPFSAWEEIGDIVRRKAVPIRQVVTHELPIEEAPQGFALADAAAAGKVVFRFE
jgi:threonine dehydrogenase-like Zn-dependent dehydrogenase